MLSQCKCRNKNLRKKTALQQNDRSNVIWQRNPFSFVGRSKILETNLDCGLVCHTVLGVSESPVIPEKIDKENTKLDMIKQRLTQNIDNSNPYLGIKPIIPGQQPILYCLNLWSILG